MAATAEAVSPAGPQSVPGSHASTPAPFFGDDPAVAVGADGSVAVAFSHLAPARRLDTPTRVQAALDRRTVLVAVRRPGGRWLPTRTVSGPGAARPQVAVGADGGVLVVWVAPACARRPPPPTGCLGMLGELQARSLARAGAWGPIVTLARNASDGFDGPPTPSVALSAHGAATIAYAGGRPRRGPAGAFASPVVLGAYAVQRGTGGRFGRPRPLPRLGVELVAAMDRAGRAYVAGTRAESGENRPAVYVSVLGRTGGWRTGSRVSAIPGSKPDIAVASDGAAIVTWIGARFESEHLEYGEVFAALAAPGSRRFGAPRLVSSAGNARAVRVVAGSARETLVSWSNASEFGQPGRGLSYCVRRTGGDFGAQQTVPDARAGEAIDAGAVVMLRGGLGLWLSQRPSGERAGLLLASRRPGGDFSPSRAIAAERWGRAVAASSSSLGAAVGERGRVLRIVTVRP